MTIELSFTIPISLIKFIQYYFLAGIGWLAFALTYCVKAKAYVKFTKQEFFMLAALQFLLWWLGIYVFVTRHLIKRRKKIAKSYFTHDEPKHVLFGGELDFY